jgi:tetratricopeptide (TPR) repeat protein
MSGTAAPTSESLRNRAFCALAGKRLDAAVAYLEAAVRMEPGNAGLLSDLSALYGERASAEYKPEDYVAALEMAERAITIDSKLPEALCNRALGLEHLFLYEESKAAWQHCLAEIDGQSRWFEEAQVHFAKVRIRSEPNFHDLWRI